MERVSFSRRHSTIPWFDASASPFLLESESVPDIYSRNDLYSGNSDAVPSKHGRAVSPDELAEPQLDWRRKVAVSQLTTGRWELDEDLEGIRAAGFGGIGLWRPKVHSFGEERAVECLELADVRVSTVAWCGAFTGSHGFTFDEAVADARDALRLAAATKAETLLVSPGGRAGHIMPQARRCVREGLKALADDPAAENVKLALAFTQPAPGRSWSFLSSLDETLDLIDSTRRGDQIGLALDSIQLVREERLLDRLRDFVPRVYSVQLCDSCHPFRRRGPDRCLPGEGRLPLAKLVRALVSSGYDGYFDVQAWSPEIWQSDYRRLLNQCRNHLNRLFAEPAVAAP